MKTVVENWGISEKIQAVVTDNGANIVAGMHHAGFKQIPCSAHYAVVTDSLRDDQPLGTILQKCSSNFSFSHHSTKASEKLKEIQKQKKST